MKNRIFILKIVLKVIELPDDSAEGDGVLRRLVKGDEGTALVAGTPRHQEMERDG